MEKRFLGWVLLVILAAGSANAQDPVIAKLLDRLTLDRIYPDVDTLVAFGTRRSDMPGAVLAQDWIHAEFGAMGFSPPDVYLDDFDANSDNVIAVLPGQVSPDEIHVVGAHYDSISDAGAGAPAPGADDNASGTAALLEIMRVVHESGLRFEATITFAAFASEELGVLGSRAFVDREITAGRAPRTGIALDVMGYYAPASVMNVAFGTAVDPVPGRDELLLAAQTATETYLPGFPWEAGDTCT